ncbi:MAG: NUDIX hydrolase [Thermosulfidibacteraceae bacterium]
MSIEVVCDIIKDVRKHKARYFKYCPYCGIRLSYTFDEKIRPYCERCGFRNFMNPTVGVAVVALEDNRILLGKRNRDPYRGRWCIPCGHVEIGEDIREAAIREFEEETGLLVAILEVIDVFSNWHNPENLTVGVWFHGKIVGGTLKAGSDLDEVAFFKLSDVDKIDMAFPTDIAIIEKIKQKPGGWR